MQDLLIYVYELPEKLTDGYCFGGGKPIVFKNVDWFGNGGMTSTSTVEIESFIKQKQYYHKDKKYLVILNNNTTFIISKEANNKQ